MSAQLVRKAIETAIQTEKDGAGFYAQMAEYHAGDASIAALFAQLSKDEQVHEKQFAKVLETLPADSGETVEEDFMYMVRATGISQVFRSEFLVNSRNLTVQDALLKALELEKASMLHYRSLLDVLGKSEALESILKAEKRHVTALMKVIISDARFRSLEDKWA